MAHSHVHTHAHPDDDDNWGEMAAGPVRTVLTTLVAVALLATLVGLVFLWPRGESMVDDEVRESLGFGQRERALVVEATDGPCSFAEEEDCRLTTFELTSGPDEGSTASIEHVASEDTPGGTLAVGDRIIVNDAGDDVDSTVRYSFADRERDQPLALLALVFAVAVVLLGRLRGLLALGGLAISLTVVLVFILPAFLHGSDPVGVAVTGAALIAFSTLYLAHGFTLRTTVALLGTFASLVIIAGLAHGFARAASLSGLADTEALDLLAFAPGLDFRGLLLAAIIIGALGVLDDVTVTQTAAVWELRRASPELGPRQLYSAGVRIGRDHIAATVNTLVLAYTAAALPMLLLISQSGLSLTDALTNETIAVEIVQTLAGSIGLVAAVPLTTALAAWVVTRTGSEPSVPEPLAPVQPRQPKVRPAQPRPARPAPVEPGPDAYGEPHEHEIPHERGEPSRRPRRQADDDFWSL